MSNYTNARILQSEMHQSVDSGAFLGESGFKASITGLLDTGDAADLKELQNHVGREYYRKLHLFGLDAEITDSVDVGFRPLTFTGLYASTAAVPSTLLSGIYGYWTLNEAAGTRYDSVNSSDMTDVNTVGSVSGINDLAANFVRTSQERMYTPSNSNLTVGDIDFTWSFWIKAASPTLVQGVINKWYDNSEREYCMYLGLAGAKLSFIVRNAANTVDTQLNEAGTITTNTWYHYICYHDSVNNKLGIIRNNGTPTTVNYSAGVYNGAVNPRELAFGCDQNLPVVGNNNYFNGAIDEVGFWKRILTADERTQLYNAGVGTTYPFS